MNESFDMVCIERDELRAQRDELLVALKCLAAEEYRDDDDIILEEARTKARIAIERAEHHA